MDALALTPCYSALLITVDVPEVYMHQLWDSVYKHDNFYRFKLDKRKRFKLTLEVFRDIFNIWPRVQGQDFDALPTDEEIVSFLRYLGHTREIHSLNDVVGDQMHQPCRTFAALINKSLFGKTSATPPKKARKFKKPASPKLTTVLVSTEEPTGKSKIVKRSAKKSTQAPARGVVIRETPEMPLSKKKEKVDVTRGKGIELLSQVALNEDAQFKEVRRKSMRDFHKTRLSGSGVVKIIPSGNDEDDSNNEQDSSDEENDSNDDKAQSYNENESDSKHEKDENELDSESNQEENEEDDKEEVEEEVVKTQSNNFDDEDETKIDDKAKGDEDEEMDYTTSLLYDDVDIRLNEPVDTDKGLQTPTLLTVPVSVISETSPIYSTIIPQSLPSFTPPPPQSTPTPPPTTEATNPPSTLLNFASVFQFDNRVTTLKKEVAELKRNDPLNI
ncbi:hypothetical protein Tco_1254012 [Tanacetum coccineum]